MSSPRRAAASALPWRAWPAAGGTGSALTTASAKEAAVAVVADITGNGGQAIAVQADVSRDEDIERLFRTADERFGPLTALVNNAGVLFRQARVDQIDQDRLHQTLATNVIGYFLCAKQAVRRMSTSHGSAGGAIVNVSSASSRLAWRVRRLRRE